MPFGFPEPVVCGASAVELYTGYPELGGDLEACGTDPRELANRLMGLGFRWAERPAQIDRGLWHAGLSMGVRIVGGEGALASSELTNVVTVAMDAQGETVGHAPWLRVIGIEDLIAQHVVRWLERCGPLSETAWAIQMLIGLGQAGVAGPFRAAYLRRRLHHETGEVVTFEIPAGYGMPTPAEPRFTSLSEMAEIIQVWQLRQGIAFDRDARGSSARTRPSRVSRPRGDPDEWNGKSAGLVTIIPFAGASDLPSLVR
jgi:hypothetical protein